MMMPFAPSPEVVISGLTVATHLYVALQPKLHQLVQAKSDRFLNYDPGFLLESYAGERPVANGITYAEICNFFELVPPDRVWDDANVVIHTLGKPFSRANGKASWQKAAGAGFTALLQSGRIKANESAIRVSSAGMKDHCLHLSVQRAGYHDQAYSNLVLDFDRQEPAVHSSLRSQLRAQYGEYLPPLDDRRLANTLGIAMLVLYRSDGQWIPYMVRRLRKIGVFPGGIHCTASGVAKWPKRASTLSDLATDHMLSELEEEVGLKPEDLIDFRPVSMCREMARGGKPQLFFGALTLLDRSALADRRKHAVNVIKATKQWPEIERDRWFRSADVVFTPRSLQTRIGKWGLTLEGAASLHFGVRYAQARLPHLSVS